MDEKRFKRLFKEMFPDYPILDYSEDKRFSMSEGKSDWEQSDIVIFLELKGQPKPDYLIEKQIKNYLGIECIVDFN